MADAGDTALPLVVIEVEFGADAVDAGMGLTTLCGVLVAGFGADPHVVSVLEAAEGQLKITTVILGLALHGSGCCSQLVAQR